jgi:hypothetical protein
MKLTQICEHIMAIDTVGASNNIIDMNNNILHNGHCYGEKNIIKEENVE